MALDYPALRREPVSVVRAEIRAGRYVGHTSGLAPGLLQTNLAILPKAFALDFMRYCQRNPKPCPLVGVSDDGDPMMRTLGREIDVRTDAAGYTIYRHGRLAESCADITHLWTDDLVAFALGCSFTFEHALERAGIPVWNIQHNTTVPMYRSSIETTSAGPFKGPMVVSMRPVARDRVEDAISISRKYPLAHGAPIHAGDPAEIGIKAIDQPDWGDPAEIGPAETPVFWACGVTPQAAVAAAAPPLCITHKPGHMLITDIPEEAEVPVFTG